MLYFHHSAEVLLSYHQENDASSPSILFSLLSILSLRPSYLSVHLISPSILSLQVTAEPVGTPSNSLLLCLQQLFTHIEEVYEEGGTIGTPEKFFALVENSMEAMPVSEFA